jgi:hypothetical protein
MEKIHKNSIFDTHSAKHNEVVAVAVNLLIWPLAS